MTKLLGLLTVAAALLATACGESSNAATDSAEKREQAMLKFSQCMRDHGIDMPDPTTDDKGNLMLRNVRRAGRAGPADDSKERTAERACRKYLAGTRQNFTPEQRAEMQDRMVKFAECMRGKGIDMPDPDFSQGPGVGFRQRIRASGVNPNDEKFQTAQSACSKQVFGGKAGPGGGPAFFEAPPPGGK